MKTLSNASILVIGAICFIDSLAFVTFRIAPWDKQPLIPGLNAMIQILFPLLYFWGGVSLRALWKSVPGWGIGIIAAITVAAAVSYVALAESVTPIALLYCAMLGGGFLVQSAQKDSAESGKGWGYLLLLAFAVFCYTATIVARERIGLVVYSKEYADMESFLWKLLFSTEPLLVFLSAYFMRLFAFSAVGQKIGAGRFVHWAALVLCILSLAYAIRFAVCHPGAIAFGEVKYYPLLYVLILAAMLLLMVFLKPKNNE